MADSRIAALVANSALADGDLFIHTDASDTDPDKKVTAVVLLQYILQTAVEMESQAGAPSTTPGKVGDIAIDTTGDRIYIATDTASSADWDLVPITGAQIKALYEGEASAFTDAQFTKLAGIETAATADQTDAEIRTAVEAATDSNVFTDADHSKLDGLSAGADMAASVYDPAGHAAQLVTEADAQTLTNKEINDFTNHVEADAVHEEVRNTSGGTLTAGTPVYASGFHVGTSLVTVDAADASSAATMPVLGVVESDISNNAAGAIIEHGELENIDTSAFSVGDIVYCSETAGQLTATIPTTDAALVQKVGEVVRSHASQGILEINLIPLPYITGAAAKLMDDTSASAMRTTLGVAIGSDVQAHDAVLDATTAAFTTADETKLDAIESGATADQTGAQIKTAYEAEADTNAFTDAEQSKLSGVEALADVTDQGSVAAAGGSIISSGAGAPSSTPSAVGDIYIDTTADIVYIATDTTGSGDWDQATGAGGGDLLASNNLSDVGSAATSRTNLGVAIGSDVQAHDAVLDATTASFTTADETKLDNIELWAKNYSDPDVEDWNRARGVFDVTDHNYGAVGDGATDDGAAFAAALSAISTAGGGVLKIPAGKTYQMNTALTWDLLDSGDGWLVIDARGAEIEYGGTGDMFTFTCASTAAWGTINSPIVLGGRWREDGSGGNRGFMCQDVRFGVFNGLHMEGFDEAQIEFYNDYAWCELNIVKDSILDATKHAIHYNGATANSTVNGGTDSFARNTLQNVLFVGGTAGEAFVKVEGNLYGSDIRHIGANADAVACDIFDLGAGGYSGTMFDVIDVEGGASGSAVFNVTGEFSGAEPPRIGQVNAGGNFVYQHAGNTEGLISTQHGTYLPWDDEAGTTYSFVFGDERVRKRNTSGGSAATWTIEPESTTEFPIGTILPFYCNAGGGLTIAAGAGVTLNSVSGLALAQHESGYAHKLFANTWQVTIFFADATDEVIQDVAGGMFTGNTETGITATYQDGDGTVDLVVDELGSLPVPTTDVDINDQNLLSVGQAERSCNTVASSGSTETLVIDDYSAHDVTMSESCTFTFTCNAPATEFVNFTLLLTGAYTPTWPASVDWPDATEPTYGTPTLYNFSSFDGGTTWLGTMAGSGFG